MKKREAYFILGMRLKNPTQEPLNAEEVEALRLAEKALGSSLGWDVQYQEDSRLDRAGGIHPSKEEE
jgi:hypothetical protein